MIAIIIILILIPFLVGTFFLGWQKAINLKHKDSDLQRQCFIGYSWTYFLFGFFVPIFRGEIVIGIVHALFAFITFGLFQLIMPFLYNKQHAVRMLTNSWVLDDTPDMNKLACEKIGIKYDDDTTMSG
tara:strand:+ start:64 stop:447 length:384 start_codon:yes stop_codon:yes gene_type:complete